mgnify:CR=1 FL=1
MHMRGTPRSMQREPTDYGDVVAEVARVPRASGVRRCGAAASRASASCSIRASASARRRRRTSSCCARQRRAARARPCRCWPAGRASRRSARLTGDASAAGERAGAPASRPRAARAVQRGARIVRVHDVAATVDAARGLAGGGAVTPIIRDRQRAREPSMSRTYFGTDGIRGTVGAAADHARLHAAPRPRRRPGAARRRERAPDGADRQGHAHLGLHARVGARGRASPPPASTCC